MSNTRARHERRDRTTKRAAPNNCHRRSRQSILARLANDLQERLAGVAIRHGFAQSL
jgi:hypothetical protein